MNELPTGEIFLLKITTERKGKENATGISALSSV